MGLPERLGAAFTWTGEEFAAVRALIGVRDITAIPIVIDGGDVVITTGTKFAFSVPFACTVEGYDLFGGATGSIVIDLKKATYSGYPTTTSITASAKPTLSSARKATSTTLTGWTTSVAAGDVIEVVVDSAATLQVATLVLKVRKV